MRKESNKSEAMTINEITPHHPVQLEEMRTETGQQGTLTFKRWAKGGGTALQTIKKAVATRPGEKTTFQENIYIGNHEGAGCD